MSRELKVGLFVVVTSVLIVAGVVFMAYKKGLFQAEITYHLASRTGSGLTVGMPLMFSGFKIGKVVNLELNDQGIVVVTIRVPSQHKKWLRKDSKFILEKPLIGSPQLKVVTVNMDSPLLSAHEVPTIYEVDDINDAIKKFQPIIEKVTLITEHIERITASLADPHGDVRKILRHSGEVTEALAQKKGLVDFVLGEKESVEAVHATLRNARTISEQVSVLLKKTDEEIYGKEGVISIVIKVLKEVTVNLTKLGRVMDNVIKISGDTAEATKDLKLLRHELDITVNSLNELINELNRKIPFKLEPEIKLP
ncbi:MAG: MlaD family protein [Syntrophales bacterium]|nr:MlaD family protein [Syntrophales bacterium]